MPPKKILVVDDEPEVRHLMEHFLTGKGLAGYTTTVDGRHLAFAFYVNNVELKEPGEMSESAMAGQALGEDGAGGTGNGQRQGEVKR